MAMIGRIIVSEMENAIGLAMDCGLEGIVWAVSEAPTLGVLRYLMKSASIGVLNTIAIRMPNSKVAIELVRIGMILDVMILGISITKCMDVQK
jgi:hypothetical protein